MVRTLKAHSIIILGLIMAWLASDLYADRVIVNFNGDWRFAQGEQSKKAAQPGFDDSGWQAVRLPHDWAIVGPFNEEEEYGYAGKLPWQGVGWYRKTFQLNASQGQRVYLDFDGVMAFPKIYINGRLAGQWDYGYTPFHLDITDFVLLGQANVIAVEVDTRKQGTRWYPGAGIYRKVELSICDPVHISHWGQIITTPASEGPMTSDRRNSLPNRVRVRTNLENHLESEAHVTIEVVLLDPDGDIVARDQRKETIGSDGTFVVDQMFLVSAPQAWDIDSPKLYTARTILSREGRVVDSYLQTFGFRTFEFTADDGFHLNGRRVQLHGVNLHHDHGPLGAAFYTRAMERQLDIMRDMGVNAIRTSHNPPAKALLDLCDRMGFVVWDEAFDKWDDKAGRHQGEPPFAAFGERHIRNLVMRDRNHPCVVVWSIGNEINNQPSDREGKSAERVKLMRDAVLKYDPTRPVGMACHIPQTAQEPILDALDLTGWNYMRRYHLYRENYPDKPIVYSESASTLSTRGFYTFPLPTRKTDYDGDRHQVSSYDLNAASWSDIPDAEFKLMQDDGFVAGEFVWTGFDYLGEPTPFVREARSSYFGIVDLCGIPKDRYYLYKSYWRPDTTTIHILPHWNWPERVAQTVPVFVYTNGDSAELFINGKSLGRQYKGSPPQKPVNYALSGIVRASSIQAEHIPEHATDGKRDTYWTAASNNAAQWLQIDLKEEKSIGYLALEFEREEKNYAYEIKVSADADQWQTVVTKLTSREPRWGGPKRIFHDVDVRARYVRLQFTDLQDNAWAGVQEFGIYPEAVESDYYDVTYQYRLRWNNVIYEPGELRAVAYQGRQKIGETTIRTAGSPASLRLTPDRTQLAATGEDLSYILVEAVDAAGTICPRADNRVQFEINGPAEIAGVGNGNPLSYEPFQADSRSLFYGKAMLILRTLEGKRGSIEVTARSQGLTKARVDLSAR